MSRQSSPDRTIETREELVDALAGLAGSVLQRLDIFTRDLPPALFDNDAFLERIKALVLEHKQSQVRVLMIDPGRAVRDGSRFLSLARRMSSRIHIRVVGTEHAGRADAFVIADRNRLIEQPLASRYDASIHQTNPVLAGEFSHLFEDMWHKAENSPELRHIGPIA